MSEREKTVSKANKITAIVVLLFLVVSCVIFFYMFFSTPCCPESPPEEFGDDMLNGTYCADAYAMTIEGEPVGGGIEALADAPTVLFGDDFEGINPWDTVDDVDVDVTDRHYFGNESAFFNSTIDNQASLEKDFSTSIVIDDDETMEIYFYIYASENWDGGDSDYFVLIFEFDGGKSIVYEIIGTFSTSDPDVATIDVSAQVTAKGMWVGINIQNIDDDYIAQHGGSLPIPSIDSISFVVHSTEDEVVNLDEIELVSLPKPYVGGPFWKKVSTGEHVSSYFIRVNYTILVSGDVDPSAVHAEFKLWMMIRNGSDVVQVLLEKTLIQDELNFNVTTGSLVTWTSKVFALPTDADVFGDDLSYAFFIQIEAWGELLNESGTFVYAMNDNNNEAFDHLHFKYIETEGSIDIIITGVFVIAPIGVAGGAAGVIYQRKKKDNGYVVDIGSSDGLSERERLFN